VTIRNNLHASAIHDFVVLLRLSSMQKPVLHIQAENALETVSQLRLLIEVDDVSFSYVFLNPKNNSLVALKYFEFSHLKDRSAVEILREIIYGDELLDKKALETFIVYNLTESSLVPEKFFNPGIGNKITEVIYGDLDKGMIVEEKIPWWELYNIYRVPAEISDFIAEKFQENKSWHKYSLLLKSHKMFNVREYMSFMKIIFYSGKIVVLVFKNHQLLLVQSFAYADANDIIYHLLNCCQQFRMNTEEVVLQVSGLIDRQSGVYTELLKYFLHFLFDEVDDHVHIADNIKDQYPVHYYSSFLKMAACV
jgi:hypothetical protein